MLDVLAHLQRAESNYQAGIVPAAERDRAKTAVMTGEAAVEAAQRRVDQAGASLQGARDTLAKTSIDNAMLPGGKIYFPPDGQIDNPFVITENLPGGTAPIVWPLDAKTGDAVLPVP